MVDKNLYIVYYNDQELSNEKTAKWVYQDIMNKKMEGYEVLVYNTDKRDIDELFEVMKRYQNANNAKEKLDKALPYLMGAAFVAKALYDLYHGVPTVDTLKDSIVFSFAVGFLDYLAGNFAEGVKERAYKFLREAAYEDEIEFLQRYNHVVD